MPPAPSTWTELSMQALGGNGVCASLGAPPWSKPPPTSLGSTGCTIAQTVLLGFHNCIKVRFASKLGLQQMVTFMAHN